ncbi:outer membrane assembly lipoprotein YfiO [Pseudomonas sp. MT3]|nr:outer membrane assembly lipoprotein YfiO [uncultured Pseudomonas sp.]
MRLLTLLALTIGCLGVQEARASSDDACYPSWNLKRDTLDLCNSLPFLSPGNDSRINLQLLLADDGQATIADRPLSDDEQQLGYGKVPFPMARWLDDGLSADADGPANGTQTSAPLADLVARIGLPADSLPQSADSFASGEGSRCRSNNAGTVQDFLGQLLLVEGLPTDERQSLARARLTLLGACQWDETQLTVMLPGDLKSAQGKAFATYLKGAAEFYSGRFGEALKAFRALQDSNLPWLQETARYMVARGQLNEAQQNAFDDMGYPDLRKVDKNVLKNAEASLGDYLKRYPQGQYAASAKGLLRRVYWLMSDEGRLAGEYAELFARRDADLGPLIQEVDNKLLVTAHPVDVRDPRLLAVLDLIQMRHHEPNEARALDSAGLAAQKELFAAQPALHDYLTAAYRLYVEEKPAEALKSLPQEIPEELDYLAFSQQALRGFALEAGNDWLGAEKLWLHLLPLVRQPLQHDQLELALAFNYERSDRLVKVFAEGSPVQTPIIREILLRHVAGPDLLRQQARSASASVEERDTALFALLYKDLLHGQYQAFIDDLALLPAEPTSKPLGASIGYLYGSMPLTLFQWPGGKNDTGYECPAIVDVARDLLQNPRPPKALNCLGEFILRNGLDGFPLDSQPSERELGGGESLFPGTAYSRMDGYLKVITDKQAPEDDRAYALFRAINCYAPSGFNGCGSQDIPPSQRKQWFRTLKSQYAATPWAKALKYYW